jgi:uncharacterized protein (TIGR02996 family)
VLDRDHPQLWRLLAGLFLFPRKDVVKADLQLALVLADWLDEQGDRRAEEVRRLVQLRPELDQCPALTEPLGKKKLFWRWPNPKEHEDLWWDVLVEGGTNPRPKTPVYYVRWQADPATPQGRAMTRHALHYVGGYWVMKRAAIPGSFDLATAELIAGLLGWSSKQLRGKRQEKT